MDLLLVVIIGLALVILGGCVYLLHSEKIHNYFTDTSVTMYKKYSVNLIDDDDAEYIKAIVPEKTMNDVLVKLLPDNKIKSPIDTIDSNMFTNNKIKSPNDPIDYLKVSGR